MGRGMVACQVYLNTECSIVFLNVFVNLQLFLLLLDPPVPFTLIARSCFWREM